MWKVDNNIFIKGWNEIIYIEDLDRKCDKWWFIVVAGVGVIVDYGWRWIIKVFI